MVLTEELRLRSRLVLQDISSITLHTILLSTFKLHDIMLLEKVSTHLNHPLPVTNSF